MNKASFLAVSAGVIIAASTVHLWTKWPLFGVTALTFSCMALTAAAIAVRPGKRIGIQARRLVDRYADSTSSAAQVEAQIILDKANAITFREDDLRARALWVSRGFAALSIASVALTVAFTAEVLRS
ncbi:hypothetical protein [Falsarthrobacter nasiphocae]|uniref:Uncharacterized protein n=1 Tax=Falsarthrobacter nasiphocae TaxID=189863 RepID=A0AAE4C6C7_9MICC|nr:hypothetical protein [Falsarthrobacter nasiphocae]MDR6891354.1 hypothetical protein [Falsarthrobacter nasiphocae]